MLSSCSKALFQRYCLSCKSLLINTRGTPCKTVWEVKYHLFSQDLEEQNETSLFFSVVLRTKCHVLHNHLNRNFTMVGHCNYREIPEGGQILTADARLLNSRCIQIECILRRGQRLSPGENHHIFTLIHKK